MALQKWQEEVEQNKLEGGFFTKADLEKEGWTETLGLISFSLCSFRSMIAKSKSWAEARGLLEINPVHGEEEWRIPRFSSTTTTGFRINETAHAVVQECTR